VKKKRVDTKNIRSIPHSILALLFRSFSGQFAIVRRCKNKKTNVEYAAKFVIKRRPNSSSRKGLFREKILQEIEILSELKHEHIISLHEVFETPTEIILVLELVTGGELFEYISEKDHLTEEEAATFITQILEGVEHFHAKNIIHLDLKPENVMLLNRQSCLIKIIDFGISRKLKPGEKVMETYGTPEFVGKSATFHN
jgi:death-associated protein kinase